MKVKCLDKGFMELITSTPDGDLLVVNAARTSFDKEHKEFDDVKDTKLIKYLAKHSHILPFRHPHVTLRIYAPIFVLRQLGKHQIGFSWSEVSRRYVSTPPEFHVPENLRTRPKSIKQGSTDIVSDKNIEYLTKIRAAEELAFATYMDMVDDGIAPEQARGILPQSMYTTTVTTGSLLGWHHMYKMRIDSHTQLETQKYAEAVDKILGSLYPVSWAALNQTLLEKT